MSYNRFNKSTTSILSEYYNKCDSCITKGPTGHTGPTGPTGPTGLNPWILDEYSIVKPTGTTGFTGIGYTGNVGIFGDLIVTGTIDPIAVYLTNTTNTNIMTLDSRTNKINYYNDSNNNDSTISLDTNGNLDISSNKVIILSGSQDPSGNFNGAPIVSKDRIYQELNPDSSQNSVNGYYGLAKEAHPALSKTTAEKAINEWISNITPTIRSRPHGIIWCPEKGLFISANVTSGYIITTSTDGLNWIGRTLLDPDSNPVNIAGGRSVAYSPELDIFVMVFINVSSFVLPNKMIATSTDGINWTQLDITFERVYIDIIWAKELGLFVAISSSADTTDQVVTSHNGTEWTPRTIPGEFAGYQSICWSAELRLLVVVRGGTNGIATSTDGIIWTTRTTPNNGHYQIDWSPSLGLFVVCSVGSGEALPIEQPLINNKMMTSPDGINWTYRSTPNNHSYRSVIWASNLNCFVAVGASSSVNQLLISFDGINWKEGTLPNTITNRCMCYSNELGIFVIGQDDLTSNFLTSSLKGRPPTSYNVFDSSFNNIDSTGNWTLKSKSIITEGTLTISNPTGGGSALELRDPVEDFYLTLEASPGNSGVFTNDTFLLQSKNINMLVNEGICKIDSQIGNMELTIGENENGSALSLLTEQSGSQVYSNNKLTIQGGGDVEIITQSSTGSLDLNSTIVNFKNTSTTTTTSTHNAEIKTTSINVSTHTFLKCQLNGVDIWIPYFTSDPSV